MDHTGSTPHRSLDHLLVGILLPLHLQRRIESHGTKPVVAVIMRIIRLTVHLNARDVPHQLLIEMLHVFVVSNMLFKNSHLTTPDTCTDITHPVVETDSSMLIVRVCVTSLGCIPHDSVCILFVATNQRATTGSSDHLVTIE